MKIQVAVLLFLGLSLASAERERQVRLQQNAPGILCSDPFELKSNPCVQGRMYLPVESDPRKFVQCDALGRAYIIQCPDGLFYNDATTACQPLPSQPSQRVPSPCPVDVMLSGHVHFPVPGDRTRYYQCTGVGQGQILQCPAGLVWDNAITACLLEVQKGAGTSLGGISVNYLNPAQFVNPCLPNQPEKGGLFYFPHQDPTKFIQCDIVGHAFVMPCPSGLVWNQNVTTCDWPTVNGYYQGK